MKVVISQLVKSKYLLPSLLLIGNFVLKIIYLDYGDIGGDEPFTIFYSQVDYPTFYEMMQNENNPPLYFVLLHFWIKIFGISPFSVRFLPLIFSSLTVLVVFMFGKKFFNLRIAILASVLFTFSNYHIFFAHETRVYSLFALLAVASMHLFLSLVREVNSKKYFLLLVIVNTFLVYSHFFGFFVVFVQVVSVLSIAQIRNVIFKKYLLISLITFILYIPYINILLSRFSSSSNGTWLTPPKLDELYNMLWKFSNTPVNTVFFLLMLVVGIVVFFMTRKKDSKKLFLEQKVVLIWFLLPYLLMFALSFMLPIFLDRYLVFISIAYYFTIAIAINFLSQSNRFANVLPIIAIALMVITCNPKSCNPLKKDELVSIISKRKTENSLVYICPAWLDLGFAYYYNIEYFKDYKNTRDKLRQENIFPINSVQEINDSLLLVSESVIYLDSQSELVDKENLIYSKLLENFPKVENDESYEGFKIFFFTK